MHVHIGLILVHDGVMTFKKALRTTEICANRVLQAEPGLVIDAEWYNVTIWESTDQLGVRLEFARQSQPLPRRPAEAPDFVCDVYAQGE
jgi:hypothetical protein